MNSKDLCFLGLLALAYLYLDSGPAGEQPVRRLSVADDAGSAPGDPVCPRDAAHPVSHRGDGALWCRGCDEGFFPVVPGWEWALTGAAA